MRVVYVFGFQAVFRATSVEPAKRDLRLEGTGSPVFHLARRLLV